MDQREAREVGEKAVQFAMWGNTNGSVDIKRTGFYSVDYELMPLEMVAGKTRTMEDEFISASGTDVTDAFRLYLRPLLGSRMPDAFRLRHHPVAKVLQKRWCRRAVDRISTTPFPSALIASSGPEIRSDVGKPLFVGCGSCQIAHHHAQNYHARQRIAERSARSLDDAANRARIGRSHLHVTER